MPHIAVKQRTGLPIPIQHMRLIQVHTGMLSEYWQTSKVKLQQHCTRSRTLTIHAHNTLSQSHLAYTTPSHPLYRRRRYGTDSRPTTSTGLLSPTRSACPHTCSSTWRSQTSSLAQLSRLFRLCRACRVYELVMEAASLHGSAHNCAHNCAHPCMRTAIAFVVNDHQPLQACTKSF